MIKMKPAVGLNLLGSELSKLISHPNNEKPNNMNELKQFNYNTNANETL